MERERDAVPTLKTSSIPTSLIQHNSFENDGISTLALISPIADWLISASSNNIGETATYDPLLAGHAEYLAIGTTGKLGVLSQTFATVPDQTYRFVFDGASGNQFDAQGNNTVLMTSSSASFNPGWSRFDGRTTYTFIETANSTSPTISFGGTGNGTLPNRPLTDIELALAQTLMGRLLRELALAFESLGRGIRLDALAAHLPGVTPYRDAFAGSPEVGWIVLACSAFAFTVATVYVLRRRCRPGNAQRRWS